VNATHTSPPAPSSATPNTSHSFASSSSSSYSSADAQFGIGLSLLQDLANGIDSSDEDEEDDIWRRLRYSRWSIGKDDDETAAYKSALRRAGDRKQDGMESEDGTVEGLMYARSEDDHDQQEPMTLEGGRPSPITTSPQSSPSNALLSPTTSPTSPSFTGPNERERRPSLTPSAESTGSWEGRIGYLRILSVFEVLDGERDANVFPVLCQRGVWVTPTPPVPEL